MIPSGKVVLCLKFELCYVDAAGFSFCFPSELLERLQKWARKDAQFL